MGQNLTGQTIASTYEDLVQISGSARNFLTDGTGSNITSLAITASFATSASFATTAATASFTNVNLQQVTNNGATTTNAIVVGNEQAKALQVLGGLEISSSQYPTLEIQSIGGTYDPGVVLQFGSTYVGSISANSATLDIAHLAGGKVAISSSTDITGSLRVTQGITGSLFGTASFAVSASFAPAGNPFPFTGSAVMTGSLAVTGSVSATGALIMGTGSTSNNNINIVNKGYTNTIGLFYDGIAIGHSNVLNFQGNGFGSAALGWSNTLGAGNFTSFNVLIGNSNTISGNGSSRIIAGGENNIQTSGSYNAILIGGSNIATAADNTVYVPNLDVSGSSTFKNNAVITGSLVIENPTDTTVFSLTQGGTSAYAISQGGGFDTVLTIPTNATHTFTGGGTNIYIFEAPTRVNNTFTVSGSAIITGSLRGEVKALSISSNTASLNCALDNFFTLQLVSGSNTFINPSNILPGQTINLRVNTTGSATVSFPTSVKQVSGSAYVPTTTTGVDVVTFISFDATSLLLSNVKNLV